MSRKLAKESECFKDMEISMPRSGQLTEEQIEEIHRIFIETDGYIGKTAQRTGFDKSTVSRYARARGWHDELIEINKILLNQGKKCKRIIASQLLHGTGRRWWSIAKTENVEEDAIRRDNGK